MANTKNRGFLIKENVGIESSRQTALLQDKNFDYNLTRYPLNLGTANFGRGHYIIFHILQQRESQYKTQDNPTGPEGIINSGLESRLKRTAGGGDVNGNAGEGVESVYDFAFGQGTTVDPKDRPKDRPKNTTPIIGPVLNGITATGAFIGKAVGPNGDLRKWANDIAKPEFLRTVEKTKQAIALYMPDNLNFVQAQGYDDISIGNSFVTALFAGGPAVFETLKNYNKSNSATPAQLGRDLFTNLSPFAASFLGSALDKFSGNSIGRAFAAAGTGLVTNPMIEVIYSSPQLRHFRFDFMFYPQNYKEGLAVQKIIQSFQFHQAPEIAPNNTSGYFLVPPSEFDIEFYYNGTENINIPTISTCVLQSMDVDYAPNGFTTYEVPGQTAGNYGGTGMPVAIKMSLDFKETSIVYKSSRQFTNFSTLGQ